MVRFGLIGYVLLAASVNLVVSRCRAQGLPRDCEGKQEVLKEYGPQPFRIGRDSMGFFATGAAVVDLNGDGWNDLVMSNGNDMSPQPLVAYYNARDKQQEESGVRRAPLSQLRPNWYSKDFEYHMNLAVGDIDKDGCPDVAVALAFDKSLDLRTGRVRVYFNRGRATANGNCRGLEETPRYETSSGYSTVACALGDADGDGWLDLAVAVANEAAGTFDPSVANGEPGSSLIYFNRGGQLERTARWRSATKMTAGDVRFGDVDQDGFLDLVFASTNTMVYYGGVDHGRVGIATSPGWQSTDERQLSYSVDIGRIGSSPTLGLAVSSTALIDGPGYREYPFELYLPRAGDPASGNPVWTSGSSGMGSRLVLADVNHDGKLDLIAGRWSELKGRKDGSPLRVYLGADQGAFGKDPAFCSDASATPVGQTIAVGDLHRSGGAPRRYHLPVPGRRAVVTLPDQIVERVTSVSRNGAQLTPREYAWAPGQSWISFGKLLEAGDVVDVAYEIAEYPDIVVADWNCANPPTLYDNKPGIMAARQAERRVP
jgi:hypothetical protein